MSLPENLFCLFLEATCIFLLMKAFQGKSFRPGKIDVIFFLSEFIWGFMPESLNIAALIVGQIVSLTYAALQLNKKLIPATFLLCATMIFFFPIQGISIVILYPVMAVLPLTYLPVLGSLTTLAIVVLVICVFPCAKFYSKLISGSFPLKFLILNTYFGAVLTVLFYKTHEDDIYESILLIFGILLLLIFVNVCIFYYDTQLREKQKAIQAYEKNRPIFETLIQDIRSNQHEYANRLQSMAYLPNVCHDYESLRSALEKYTKEYNTKQRSYPLLTINMPLIASTLYSLSAKAEKKEVEIIYEIPNSNLTCRLSEHIIVDFIHILTQNAIEATSPKNYMYVRMLNQEERFHFEVRNPVEQFYTTEEIDRFFEKGFTTKTNSSHPKLEYQTPHGYGLSELLAQVNKLGGTVSADFMERENRKWLIFSFTI